MAINSNPSSGYSQKAHILVVDDDPDLAAPLVAQLSQFGGYVVSEVHGGEEAIELMINAPVSAAGPVDIVLLDLLMPDISGLDVLKWIRARPELDFTRVLMLTATTSKTERIRALSAGADDYITKPYESQELLARVRTNLRSRQLEKQMLWQSQQLSALNRVSRSVAAHLDIQQVLAAALDGVESILNVEVAAVYILNNAGDLLTCWSLWSEDGSLTVAQSSPVPAGKGMIGLACVEQAILYFNEGGTHAAYSARTDAPMGVPIRSMMAGGLVLRPRAIGTLVAWNKRHGKFTDFDADLFNSLANAISRAIENAWLVQRLQVRQQELLARRNRLQAVMDGILQPIYTVDQDWRLVEVNKTRAGQLEMKPSELVGKVCYEVFFDREDPCDHCLAAASLASKQPKNWSVRWLGLDHLPQEWDVSAYPLPKTKNEGEQSVVVWQDRTEARRLESSLMQASKLAAIGQLAAGVAHEINNPLTVINANAEMLKLVLDKVGDEFEMVDLIARAGDRAAKVVRNLLNSARQEEYEFETLDVNESILQAMELVIYQLQSAEVNVVQDLEADLPPIVASNEHMKSVWINLLVNAGDAVKDRPGERRVELVTRLGPDQQHVQILVRDNGIGMNAAQMGHIFEPFYTTKEPDRGTGLGLATCYRIVEQHGGQIDVLSDPGEGTTFIVMLPAKETRPDRNEADELVAP